MQPIDLVLHDWLNMPRAEREQALKDVRALAETHAGDQRRARALNVMATFFDFLKPARDEPGAGAVECGQARCENPATHWMFWPGQPPAPVCQEHRLCAMRIADSMGFELVLEPLTIQQAAGR